MSANKYFASMIRWLIGTILGGGAFVVASDPYGVHQWHDPWLTPGKYFIKLHERKVKPIHFLWADPQVVSFGSSRTAVGVDPKELEALTGLKAYNYGITGAHIDEMAVAVTHALSSKKVEAIVVGLDLTGFTAVHSDEAQTLSWLVDGSWEQRLTTIGELSISLAAVKDAVLTLIKNLRSEPGNYRLDGYYSGYEPTPGAMTEYESAELPPLAEAFIAYEKILSLAAGHHIRTYLYISPTYGSKDVASTHYRSWASKVEMMAAQYGLKVIRPDLNEDITRNQENFLDASHYNKGVGTYILKSLFKVN